MKALKSCLSFVLVTTLVAGFAERVAAQNMTSVDIERLQDGIADASSDVAQLQSRDRALASELERELDDLREETIYLKVKLRKNETVPRPEYFDLRDRIDELRSRARRAPAATPAPSPRPSSGTAARPTAAPGTDVPKGTERDVRLKGSLSSAPAGDAVAMPFAFDGPPPPVPPAVIARDTATGRTTIRAVQLTAPLRIDGQLDDDVYESVASISDFIQTEPIEGAPATEKTEVWIFFDRDNVYVSVRCWESQPERMIVNEMRRDSLSNLLATEHISFMFDTFFDKRVSTSFGINAIGGRFDGQTTGGQYTGDWNPIWNFATGRFSGGWAVEAAIPFKSLRYRLGRAQIWGFNIRRTNRWKNEISYVIRIPNAVGNRALQEPSFGATLVGIQAPAGSKNLEIKPYATANTTTDLNATPRVSNKLGRDWGADVKYGLTQNMTADFTYKTDFAQVEADEQQVNLTRFSLFFPEKRDFFLENQGLFGFGGALLNAAGDTPLLFHSRQIGLLSTSQGARVVPIQGGGRLTGRMGRFSVGVLDIQSDLEPVSASRATNFSTLRIKRDILRRSSVGALYTRRSIAQNGTGTNEAYGLDGTFGFFNNLSIRTYWAQTRASTSPVADATAANDDTSYRAQLDYPGDRYGLQLEHLMVGDAFNPEMGFVRRRDMRKSYVLARFSPRPKSIKSIRRFSWTNQGTYVENLQGRPETRIADTEFAVEFQNSDRLSAGYTNEYELLPRPFRVAPTVTLPVGSYEYDSARVGYNFGQQRKLSGSVLAEYGSFYDGHRAALSVSRGRLSITPRVAVEPGLTVNALTLVEGSSTSALATSRVTYTATPFMFVSALMQYNTATHTVSTNARLRWEYKPGSELFVVYNDERDTLVPRFPGLLNRALIIKVNRLLRF